MSIFFSSSFIFCGSIGPPKTISTSLSVRAKLSHKLQSFARTKPTFVWISRVQSVATSNLSLSLAPCRSRLHKLILHCSPPGSLALWIPIECSSRGHTKRSFSCTFRIRVLGINDQSSNGLPSPVHCGKPFFLIFVGLH